MHSTRRKSRKNFVSKWQMCFTSVFQNFGRATASSRCVNNFHGREGDGKISFYRGRSWDTSKIYEKQQSVRDVHGRYRWWKTLIMSDRDHVTTGACRDGPDGLFSTVFDRCPLVRFRSLGLCVCALEMMAPVIWNSQMNRDYRFYWGRFRTGLE